jgi:hypothetical protein
MCNRAKNTLSCCGHLLIYKVKELITRVSKKIIRTINIRLSELFIKKSLRKFIGFIAWEFIPQHGFYIHTSAYDNAESIAFVHSRK